MNRSACLEKMFSLDSEGIFFLKNSMSLGLVLLKEKLFTRTWTLMQMPQSDAIMSISKKDPDLILTQGNLLVA